MELDFVRIECELVTDIPVQLTSVLYGALRSFEGIFKAASCRSRHESCSTCAEYDDCPYLAVFARQLSSDPEIVRLHQKPSLPFSLYIREPDCTMTVHTVGLVVIGTAVNHLEYFHTALLHLAESCIRAVKPNLHCLLQFFSLDYHDARHIIPRSASLPGSVILLSGQHVLQSTVNHDHVGLSLISPLRVLSNGSVMHHFDFAAFFCSQLRRCSSLCAYYGVGELELDYGYLSHAAQNVAVLEDEIFYTHPSWSKRQSCAGLVGRVECSGLVEPMCSLLLLGSYFNAGKRAAFGSGFHHIEVY